MKTLVTLSDKHYLDRGIALYESIEKLMKIDYKLYYLCLDKVTFNKLKEINNEKLIPLYIKDEFHNNKDFDILVKSNISIPNGHSDYHFALGSFFTNHIMEKESPEEILYIDADIIFYYSPEIVFKYTKDKSIGLILHRHNHIGAKVGGFNVGIIYFNNNIVGRKCLKWWRDIVMNKNDKWYITHGIREDDLFKNCVHLPELNNFAGDQKCLESFEQLFGKENIKILDEDMGHGAPWNFTLYEYFNEKRVIRWNGVVQALVFNHFSHFIYNEDSYSVDRDEEWREFKLLENLAIKRYYDKYFEILKDVKQRYKL